MSNSLDPDQARRFVGPDLGPNCLPKFSADGTGRQRVVLCAFLALYDLKKFPIASILSDMKIDETFNLFIPLFISSYKPFYFSKLRAR